ncbi:hypothetical protein ACFOD4_11755 [Pseudoroseomonas globiformis]|uniref:Lipoprotein n=1 Tax=Teichococcus globiformis TaxID=2307229 RepID=A0ABV7G695_9PROT
MRRGLLILLLLVVAGCESGGKGENTAAAAGGIGGIAVGGLTSNPAVGYAVGLGIRTVVEATLSGWFRSMTTDEQNAIAALAGSLPAGQPHPWLVERGLPFGWRDSHGKLEVTRVMETPLASCREVMFTLEGREGEAPEGIFVATACHQGRGWKWAAAEPAVDRWGALQ